MTLKGKGIKQQELTTSETPQYNGVAERINRTLLNNVRVMLADADLPNVFWFEALTYAVHLHNLSPTRTLENMTPDSPRGSLEHRGLMNNTVLQEKAL